MGKVKFEESETIINLARSFASETMEGARYQFMAQKCANEKMDYLNIILKTLAKHEMSHAKVFWDYIVNNSTRVVNNINIDAGFPFESGSIDEEFKYADSNERDLADNIYPEFAKIARDEGYEDIAHSFDLVATVENCHSLLTKQIYEKLRKNKVYKSPKAIKWKCNQCGFEHTAKEAWEICPLCHYDQGYAEIPLDMGTE